MEKVFSAFNNYLMSKFSSSKEEKKESRNEEESKDGYASFSSTLDSGKNEKKKGELKQAMGSDVFNYYYDFLKKHRADPSTDEAKLRASLNQMIGTNKELKNLIFELE